MHTLLYVVVVYVCAGRWDVRMHTDVGTTESGLLSSKRNRIPRKFWNPTKFQKEEKQNGKTTQNNKSDRVVHSARLLAFSIGSKDRPPIVSFG